MEKTEKIDFTDPYDWVHEQDRRFPLTFEQGLPLTIKHYGEDSRDKKSHDLLDD